MTIRKCNTKKGTSYVVDLYSSGRGSKRIRRSFKRKIDAQNFLDNYMAEKQNFKKSGQAVNLLEEVLYKDEAQFWIETMKNHFSVGHLKRVKGILAEQLERFGNYTLDRMDAAFLTSYQRELKSRRQSNSTINRKTEVITAIFNNSVRHRRIPYTPAIGFRKLPAGRVEMAFWEKEDITSFLQAMHIRYPKGSVNRWRFVAYLTALNTGLRAGELWGLKPEDLSSNGETLFIRRQLNRITKEFDLLKGKRNAKSGRLSRHVPCNPNLKAELLEIINIDNETIFANSEGNPIDHDNYKRVFQKDLKAWGGNPIRFHDLRHSAITQMIASGIDIKTVQAIAGHEDIKTTMNYVHLVGDSIKEVARNFSLSYEPDKPANLKLISGEFG
ncbi:MAG: hypothetical protein CME65_04195 [Halobacteriovoraceae bacterium]|nr:hypothetical protein [Halobacteriovoraceae bacterium]|tara:strand:- start:12291 stop:13445 length:1155 start_codon:yes stop_codon:yes gene_type:complete